MHYAPKQSVSADKRRILTQLRVNLQNMPDDPVDVDDLVPQLKMQAAGILGCLRPGDFRPAELMALMSLIGPVLARTPVLVPPKPKQRTLRAV